MDREPALDWSVARCRPGRHVALCALVLVSVLGFSLRAEGNFAEEQDEGARPSAAPTHALRGSATERFAVCLDQLIDPFEDDDPGFGRLAAPSFQASESPASYGCLSAPLDTQSLASSNPARGPPSA
jgi:hypothetical protein